MHIAALLHHKVGEGPLESWNKSTMLATISFPGDSSLGYKDINFQISTGRGIAQPLRAYVMDLLIVRQVVMEQISQELFGMTWHTCIIALDACVFTSLDERV
jgi:hypothetical protein